MSIMATVERTLKKSSVSTESRQANLQTKHSAAGPGLPLFLQRRPLVPPESTLKVEERGLPEDTPALQAEHEKPDIQRQTEVGEEESALPEEECVQTRLTIGEPDDEYEKEADQLADQVMRQSEDSVGTESEEELEAMSEETPLVGSAVQRRAIGRNNFEEDKSLVQTRLNGAPGRAPRQLSNNLRSPGSGSPLPTSVRTRVEPVLGVSLGHVRVHSDARANATAKSIGAKAFTHKNNIWLGGGQSAKDLHLMSHEAAHVVQQRGVETTGEKAVSGEAIGAPWKKRPVSFQSTTNSDVLQRRASSASSESAKAVQALRDRVFLFIVLTNASLFARTQSVIGSGVPYDAVTSTEGWQFYEQITASSVPISNLLKLYQELLSVKYPEWVDINSETARFKLWSRLQTRYHKNAYDYFNRMRTAFANMSGQVDYIDQLLVEAKRKEADSLPFHFPDAVMQRYKIRALDKARSQEVEVLGKLSVEGKWLQGWSWFSRIKLPEGTRLSNIRERHQELERRLKNAETLVRPRWYWFKSIIGELTGELAVKSLLGIGETGFEWTEAKHWLRQAHIMRTSEQYIDLISAMETRLETEQDLTPKQRRQLKRFIAARKSELSRLFKRKDYWSDPANLREKIDKVQGVLSRIESLVSKNKSLEKIAGRLKQADLVLKGLRFLASRAESEGYHKAYIAHRREKHPDLEASADALDFLCTAMDAPGVSEVLDKVPGINLLKDQLNYAVTTLRFTSKHLAIINSRTKLKLMQLTALTGIVPRNR